MGRASIGTDVPVPTVIRLSVVLCVSMGGRRMKGERGRKERMGGIERGESEWVREREREREKWIVFQSLTNVHIIYNICTQMYRYTTDTKLKGKPLNLITAWPQDSPQIVPKIFILPEWYLLYAAVIQYRTYSASGWLLFVPTSICCVAPGEGGPTGIVMMGVPWARSAWSSACPSIWTCIIIIAKL